VYPYWRAYVLCARGGNGKDLFSGMIYAHCALWVIWFCPLLSCLSGIGLDPVFYLLFGAYDLFIVFVSVVSRAVWSVFDNPRRSGAVALGCSGFWLGLFSNYDYRSGG